MYTKNKALVKSQIFCRIVNTRKGSLSNGSGIHHQLTSDRRSPKDLFVQQWALRFSEVAVNFGTGRCYLRARDEEQL